MQPQTGASKEQGLNQNCVTGFRYQAFLVTININDSIFIISINHNLCFFTKKYWCLKKVNQAFSFYIKMFLLGRFENIYFLHVSLRSREKKCEYVIKIPKGIKNIYQSKWNGDPIGASSICLEHFLLNLKDLHLFATLGKLRKNF